MNSELGSKSEPRIDARRAITAANVLIRQHVSLVKRIAYYFARRVSRHVEADDLIQAGMVGLVEASQRYEPDRNSSFETYAGIRIRGQILDHLRKLDWSPRTLHRRLRSITALKGRIENETGKAPTSLEVAAALEISLDDYHRTLRDADS